MSCPSPEIKALLVILEDADFDFSDAHPGDFDIESRYIDLRMAGKTPQEAREIVEEKNGQPD